MHYNNNAQATQKCTMQTKTIIWQQAKWDVTIHNDHNEQLIKWIATIMHNNNNDNKQWTMSMNNNDNDNDNDKKFVMKKKL